MLLIFNFDHQSFHTRRTLFNQLWSAADLATKSAQTIFTAARNKAPLLSCVQWIEILQKYSSLLHFQCFIAYSQRKASDVCYCGKCDAKIRSAGPL